MNPSVIITTTVETSYNVDLRTFKIFAKSEVKLNPGQQLHLPSEYCFVE